MASNISLNSIDCDVSFAEQLSREPSPQRNNSPNNFNSTDLSGLHTREMPTLSSVTSPEPDIVTLEDDSSDPTFLCQFRAQQPIVPPNWNNLYPPSHPFNVLATMAVVQLNPTQHDKNYNHQSLELSRPSPISTPPMNLSMIDSWEALHTTTDDITFYSEDEHRRVHWNSPLDGTSH